MDEYPFAGLLQCATTGWFGGLIDSFNIGLPTKVVRRMVDHVVPRNFFDNYFDSEI